MLCHVFIFNLRTLSTITIYIYIFDYFIFFCFIYLSLSLLYLSLLLSASTNEFLSYFFTNSFCILKLHSLVLNNRTTEVLELCFW